MKNRGRNIERGDIIYVDLFGATGSEQQKTRPCLVIQNNIGNKFSPTTIVLPIGHKPSADKKKPLLPTQVEIMPEYIISGEVDGIILCEQIRTIDEKRIEKKVARLSNFAMEKIETAIKSSLGFL